VKEPFTAEMAAIVARQERERIMKLLEVTYDSEHFVGLNMHEVIALIKGENK
jgi:hypothetical protein